MFAVMSRLIATRLHLQPGHLGEAVVKPVVVGNGSK
jgi:hypothetical protein